MESKPCHVAGVRRRRIRRGEHNNGQKEVNITARQLISQSAPRSNYILGPIKKRDIITLHCKSSTAVSRKPDSKTPILNLTSKEELL
jgi:hypothetical protein